MSPQEQIVARFAPTGTLRAAINLGNPILAGSDPSTGAARGVSVDLARELGRRLGVAVELLTVDTAGKSVEAVAHERADIGFFAIDPLRGADIAFTAPYVLIEGCYLVRDGSPLRSNDEVDRAGHVVVVGAGQRLRPAPLARAEARDDRSRADVAGRRRHLRRARCRRRGRRQAAARGRRRPHRRLAPARRAVHGDPPGDGTARRHAARTPPSTSQAFVEDMKASGFVAAALARHWHPRRLGRAAPRRRGVTLVPTPYHSTLRPFLSGR